MKIEFDIPEFKRELKIEITLRRDGEVIYSAQSDTAEEMEYKEAPEPSTTTKAKKTTPKSGGGNKGGGNMMNIEEL
jgi:hypothetical protein